MKTRDYISLIAIERLLEDETLPADIRQQARHVYFELYLESQAELKQKQAQQYWEDYSGQTEEAIEQARFNRYEE